MAVISQYNPLKAYMSVYISPKQLYLCAGFYHVLRLGHAPGATYIAAPSFPSVAYESPKLNSNSTTMPRPKSARLYLVMLYTTFEHARQCFWN